MKVYSRRKSTITRQVEGLPELGAKKRRVNPTRKLIACSGEMSSQDAETKLANRKNKALGHTKKPKSKASPVIF